MMIIYVVTECIYQRRIQLEPVKKFSTAIRSSILCSLVCWCENYGNVVPSPPRPVQCGGINSCMSLGSKYLEMDIKTQ